ncbi:unnamed protein product [Rhodiola kirilowii]
MPVMSSGIGGGRCPSFSLKKLPNIHAATVRKAFLHASRQHDEFSFTIGSDKIKDHDIIHNSLMALFYKKLSYVGFLGIFMKWIKSCTEVLCHW